MTTASCAAVDCQKAEAMARLPWKMNGSDNDGG